MPSVISAEPSSASVATMPTSNGPEPDRRQVDRQQHGDEAVAEVAQRPRRIDICCRAAALRCLINLLEVET